MIWTGCRVVVMNLRFYQGQAKEKHVNVCFFEPLVCGVGSYLYSRIRPTEAELNIRHRKRVQPLKPRFNLNIEATNHEGSYFL